MPELDKNINTSVQTALDGSAVGFNEDGDLVNFDTKRWSRGRITIKPVTLTSYLLSIDDEGVLLLHVNSAASIITVPSETVLTDWPIGGRCRIMRHGSGTLRVNPAAGVTLKTAGRPKLRANGSVAELIKIASDTWVLTGDTID